jgi:hypothetical protein
MFGDIEMQYIKNRGTTLGSRWRKAIDNIGFNIFDVIVVIINNMIIKQLVVVLDFITNVLKGFVGILYYHKNVDVDIQTYDEDFDTIYLDHNSVDREWYNNTVDCDNGVTDEIDDICDESLDDTIDDTKDDTLDEPIDDTHMNDKNASVDMIDPTRNEEENLSTTANSDELETSVDTDKIHGKLDENYDQKRDEKHDVIYTKIKIGKRNNKINVVSEQL